MKNQLTLTSVLALAACSAFSVRAAAQETAAPVEPLPASAASPASPPPSSMPLAEQPRADVFERSWPNRPMLITGGVLLGGTYVASVIVGAVSDREADKKLYYPVVGPWVDLKNRDCEVNACGSDTFNKALIIGSGALQGAGAVLMVLGLVIPESTEKPWYLIGGERLHVTPQVGVLSTGLTASGRF